jgi:hypothetical protein
LTVTGNATITGNLTVSGTTTTINTETILLADNIITLNSNFTTGTPTENAGIEVSRGSSATVRFIWDESTDRWYADNTLQVVGNVILSGTIDTGQGATEVFLMNQNVRTTDNVTHARITTTGLFGPSGAGNIPIWQYDAANTGFGIVYNESSPDTLRIDVSGNALTGTPDVLIGPDYININGNTTLHAGNFTSYTLPIGGSWYGLNVPGSRWGGYAVNGGEIVFGRDLPNVGQMGMLIDGAYLAGENNGFWSLPSDNNWNGRRGFNWDGTQLNFTTNSPIALFSDLRAPIFYDSNDTTYRIDGNNTSVLNNLNIAGTLTVNGTINLGNDYQIGNYKYFSINGLGASATQARRFEVARIGIDFNDWNSVGLFEVELAESYYDKGLRKRYVVSYGYVSAASVQLVEANGIGTNNFRVIIGSEVVVSGDHRYIPVFVEVRSYTFVDVLIKTTRSITTNSNTAVGQTWINTSPSPTNISDFTADSIVNLTSGQYGIAAPTLNTGHGDNELYAMDQNVRTTDSPTFASINTGPGFTEVHLMNQNLRTTDDVTFSTIRGTNFRASNAYYLGENNFYFNLTNGGWYSNVRVQSEVDMRAPIFYDQNNTGFFLDPLSTSNLNVLETRGVVVNRDSNTSSATAGYLSLWTGSGTTSKLQFVRTDQLYGPHGAVTDQYASYWLMDSTNRGWILRHATGDTTGTNVFSVRNNDGRTTIGTSFGVGAGTRAQLNVSAGTGGATTYRDIDMQGSWSGGEGHAITATYSTGIGNIVGQMVFQHDGPGSRMKWGRLYASGDQSNYPMELISDNSGTGARLEMNVGSMRAPIFYDYDNTGYYLDPNSTTAIRTVGSWRADSSSWDGEFAGKIQYHSSHWYFQSADQWIFRDASGNNRAWFRNDGQLVIRNNNPTITFRDTDHNTGFIHVNSNIFYILRGSNDSDFGNWGTVNGWWPLEIRLDTNNATFGGSVTVRDNVDATTFRDRDNTGFFIDPASTSIVDIMRFGGNISTNTANNSKIFGMFVPDGKYQTRNWHAGDGGYVWGLQYVTGMSDSPIGSYSHRGTGEWEGWRQNGWVPIDRTKTYKVSAWLRTISGNPFCFLSFTQAGFDYSQPDNGGWGQPYYFAGAPSSTWTEYTMTIGPAGSGAQYSWYGYARFMQLGFLHNYLYSGFSGRAEFVGFKIEEVDNTLAANTNALGDLYADRFVDRNNGSYYVDPASSTTSFYMNGGMITTAPGGTILMKHAVSEVDAWIFQENAPNWGLYWKNAPSGQHVFGQYTSVGAELVGMSAANASGRGVQTSNFVGATSAWAQWMLSNYTGYIWSASTIYAAGDMRSPIFYDANNTGFYFDGASDSQFNTGTFQGRMRYSNYLVSNNEGGLMGNYNVTGTASKLIWTIGESWPIGNMYGLGYEYASSTYLPGDPHVIALRNNGTTYTRLQMNGGIYTTGAIFSTVAMYTPIYYDSNNTAYYLDPNGTSNLGGLTLESNVSTGRASYGSSTANLVLLASSTYGRATIDFRSGVNYPSDGAQIYYETATNGSSGETSRLVIRTENDADDSILIRGGFVEINSTTVDGGSTNPGFRVLYNGNARMYSYSDNTTEFGSFRAPIFYDSNNTAFFTDPAGRSRLSSMDYGDGGYFFTGGDWGWRHQTPFGWIQFGPANSSHAHIYTSLSNFYFNAQLQVNGGSLINTNDIQANIFYDRQNTAFYVDPAADLSIRVDGEISNSNYQAGAMQPGALNIGRTDRNYAWDGTSWAGDIRLGILANTSETWEFGIHDSGDSVMSAFYFNGGDQLLLGRNIGWGTLYIEAARDFRAPIFYDSNNTGFYVDPASTSAINNLFVSFGGNVLFDPGWGFYGFPGLNANSYAGAPIMGFTYSNNAPYSGQLVSFGSGGYNLQLNSSYGGSGGGLAYRARNGDNGTWNPWRYPVIYGFNANGGGDIFATIYYDQNDTGYYIDPNSVSRLAILRIPAATSGYSLMLGPETTSINGVTHVLNDNARHSLQVNAPFYPHIGIGSTSNSGNATHGPVLSFQGW